MKGVVGKKKPFFKIEVNALESIPFVGASLLAVG
jgi:hypothetical protein